MSNTLKNENVTFNEPLIMKFDRGADEFLKLTREASKNVGDAFGEAVVGSAQYFHNSDLDKIIDDVSGVASLTKNSIGDYAKAVYNNPYKLGDDAANIVGKTTEASIAGVKNFDTGYEKSVKGDYVPEFIAAAAFGAGMSAAENTPLGRAQKIFPKTLKAKSSNPVEKLSREAEFRKDVINAETIEDLSALNKDIEHPSMFVGHLDSNTKLNGALTSDFVSGTPVYAMLGDDVNMDDLISRLTKMGNTHGDKNKLRYLLTRTNVDNSYFDEKASGSSYSNFILSTTGTNINKDDHGFIAMSSYMGEGKRFQPVWTNVTPENLGIEKFEKILMRDSEAGFFLKTATPHLGNSLMFKLYGARGMPAHTNIKEN